MIEATLPETEPRRPEVAASETLPRREPGTLAYWSRSSKLKSVKTLLYHAESRKNNLNAVRLFLALSVLYSHCFPLALGLSAAKIPNFQNEAGYVAVNLFFFISGFLITASWLRSKSMNDYLRKRVLRIYPGFVGALFVSTLLMTAVNPRGLVHETMSRQGIKAFFYDCFWLSSGSVTGPNVFPQNPFPNGANGSLWTIPIEFKCYLVVCLIGLFCLFRFRWMILGVFVYIYYLVGNEVLLGRDVSHLNTRFWLYFFAGVCAWLWRDKIPIHWLIALAAGLLLTVAYFIHLPWALVDPFALTYIVLWLGYFTPVRPAQWCNSTDLSYGVYLYAFPVQQTLATMTWARNPWMLFIAALPITLLAAFGSWHLIENRFLQMKGSQFLERDPAKSATEIRAKEQQLCRAF